jgi:hypothetical protein
VEQVDGALYMKVDEWKRFGAGALDHEQLRALLTQLLPATNERLIRPMQEELLQYIDQDGFIHLDDFMVVLEAVAMYG